LRKFQGDPNPAPAPKGNLGTLGSPCFYLPHMEYEESIGFVMRKMNFFIADFHVLGLSMSKKHDLSDKQNFRRSRAVAVPKICTSPTGSALSARKLLVKKNFVGFILG
jgi:hypothetical protein